MNSEQPHDDPLCYWVLLTDSLQFCYTSPSFNAVVPNAKYLIGKPFFDYLDPEDNPPVDSIAHRLLNCYSDEQADVLHLSYATVSAIRFHHQTGHFLQSQLAFNQFSLVVSRAGGFILAFFHVKAAFSRDCNFHMCEPLKPDDLSCVAPYVPPLDSSAPYHVFQILQDDEHRSIIFTTPTTLDGGIAIAPPVLAEGIQYSGDSVTNRGITSCTKRTKLSFVATTLGGEIINVSAVLLRHGSALLVMYKIYPYASPSSPVQVHYNPPPRTQYRPNRPSDYRRVSGASDGYPHSSSIPQSGMPGSMHQPSYDSPYSPDSSSHYPRGPSYDSWQRGLSSVKTTHQSQMPPPSTTNITSSGVALPGLASMSQDGSPVRLRFNTTSRPSQNDSPPLSLPPRLTQQQPRESPQANRTTPQSSTDNWSPVNPRFPPPAKSTFGDVQPTSDVQDIFKHLPTAPDLGGKITIQSHQPVYSGSFSRVYRGEFKQGTQQVAIAIKVLNEIRGAGAKTMQRKLERERRTWGALRHPNILPLYGFVDDDEMFKPHGALVSPWCKNGDAQTYLEKNGPSLGIKQRINLWKDVIAGVDYLHSHSPLIIHGDLKARNVLIDDSGKAQLCDFGLVTILADGNSGMTTTSPYAGTERYLSRELLVGGEDASPTTASDVYAAGCIGLEFIFSKIPYSSRKNNYRGGIFADIKARLPPATCPADLTPALQFAWAQLAQCWDLDPSKRPPASSLLLQMGNWKPDTESDTTRRRAGFEP